MELIYVLPASLMNRRGTEKDCLPFYETVIGTSLLRCVWV